MPGTGIGKLVSAQAVRKAVVSHIGLNPETQQKMIRGEIEVELVPQGTFIERIRAAGFGLGGILTPTGARRAIVAMQRTAKGKSKIVPKCALPLTTVRPVDLVVTELAVISFGSGRATLVETAPGVWIKEFLMLRKHGRSFRIRCRT